AVSVVRHVGGRKELPWYAATFPGQEITSMAKLAAAYDELWQYQFLYDAFSALVHSRGLNHDVTIAGNILSVHHPHDPTWFETIAFFVLSWHSTLLITA